MKELLFLKKKRKIGKGLGEARLMILRNHGTLALEMLQKHLQYIFLRESMLYQVRALSEILKLTLLRGIN